MRRERNGARHTTIRGTRCALLCLACLLATSQTRGHDIPNERVDRAIQVDLARGELRVEYEVSLSELTLAQDYRKLGGTLPVKDQAELFESYARLTGPLNAKGFLASIDGTPASLGYVGHRVVVEIHPRLFFKLAMPLPARGRLRLRDMNYESSEGTSRLALRHDDTLRVAGFDGPTRVDAIEERPTWMLSDEEEEATKALSVDFSPADGPNPTPRKSQNAVAGEPSEPVARSPMPAVESPALSRLLDRAPRTSWLVLAALGLMLGAAHAIQPGHGKTIIAAASLDRSTGPWGIALLCFVTTVSHFAVVVLLAAGLWFTGATRFAAIHRGLVQFSGFLIASIGLWRLGFYAMGRPEPAVAGASAASVRPTKRGLIALGVAGGAIPCWDAVLLVIVAAMSGLFAQGMLLLAAFSLGMAVVLLVVGVAAGRLNAWIAAKGQWDWSRWLGIAGGLALAAIGIGLWAS